MGILSGKLLKRAGVGLGVALLAVVIAVWTILSLSRPQLEGRVRSDALAANVTVDRDAGGVPAITGADRADVAYATGYLHAQERFFQMDLLRRLSAGELSALVGPKALPSDRAMRLHRLRARTRDAILELDPRQRKVFGAYVRGVNDGLQALKNKPFEYILLNASPEPWTLEDSFLSVYTMYLDLQDENGDLDYRRGLLADALGPAWAALLYPAGSPFDAPIAGKPGEAPAVPPQLPPALLKPASGMAALEEPFMPGSNNFAVGGKLSATGSAIVADDMHLALRVPNVWYRARLRVEGSQPLDITGVTLPGTPLVVVGSNRRIAWAYTNSNADTSDLVAIEWTDRAKSLYKTPKGVEKVRITPERICVAGGDCETLNVEETLWGPLRPETESGAKRYAIHWTGHSRKAVNANLMDLEQAANVPDAIQTAHRAGIPAQNFVVGDKDGNIAWTLAGLVPDRYGFDGTTPQSWADGRKGWSGFLRGQDIPVVMNPENARLWTANGRIVAGDTLKRIGEGGYDAGARGGRIRDLLMAKNRFTEKDFLTIQLDDRNMLFDRWEALLKAEAKRTGRNDLAAALKDWNGRAGVESVSYRAVKTWRAAVIDRVLKSYTSPIEKGVGPDNFPWIHSMTEPAVWALVSGRATAPVPPGYKNWTALMDATLGDLDKKVKDAGGYDRFQWGKENITEIRHPLSGAVPFLSLLTDPEQVPVPGDRAHLPRVNGGVHGASERMVVSPGHEEEGIFEMPSGQSGHPLSPYFNKGHENWIKGIPSPFLPGPAKWTLRFEPK